WLHRSAFSFGGLGGVPHSNIKDPKLRKEDQQRVLQSSQTPKNLIIGSSEANTIMIRPESTIKRLVQYVGDHLVNTQS
ncbi:hypothetical protein DL93DRAFT_2084399, partial [Clavulina sp. PMI_390]